jgi:hypothetical protein
MPKRRRRITPKEDAESFGYIGLFVGFLIAYFGAEITPAARPHPIHWLVAGTGAAVVGDITYGIIYWQRTRRRPR